MVREWELDDVVQLLGARASDEVLREYQRATVFALPCVEADDGDVDGIPNVLLEAMACGVPALSTDLSAIRELIVSGRNGVLVPPDDTTALAIGLRDLLANPSRRADLGEAGRATVAAGFDADINARRFASVLWPEHMAELAGAGQYR
jgi:glycosyltransferase involved in cell wall biosynthesis